MHNDDMRSSIEVYVPVAPARDAASVHEARAVRDSDARSAIGLLDNHKRNSDRILQHLEQRLRADYGEIQFIRAAKPEAGKPAPGVLIDELAAKCRIVITGVGD